MKLIQTTCLGIALLFCGMVTFAQVTLEEISQRGKLIIGTSGTQAPYSMISKSGDAIGFEIDLAQNLADAMGVELEIKVMTFEELLPAVEKGEIDGAMSGITMTASRNKSVVFVGPYSITGKSLVTTKSVLKKLNKDQEEELGKLKFVALKGSNSEVFIKEAFPTAESVGVADYDKGVKMIEDGKADALVADYATCVMSVFESDDLDLRYLADPLSVEPIGMALGSTDVRLINLIENHFNTMELSGDLEIFDYKWFVEGEWVGEVELD